MSRIKSIEIRLPNLSDFEKEENAFLYAILSQFDNVKKEKNNAIEAGREGLFPKIIFKKSEINNPQISFVTNDKIGDFWEAGDLLFGFNLSEKKEAAIPREIENCETLKDRTGGYIRLKLGSKKYSILSMRQVMERFDGKLEYLDHAAVHFGPAFLAQAEYFFIKKEIAKRADFYNYPAGEEWPFIIPATDEEYLNGISDKTIRRDPAFGIVYYKYHVKPIIHLDIKTKLSKEEIFWLLPFPYGSSLRGLEDYTRMVFILTDWLGVIFRLDLRIKENQYNIAGL